MTKLQDTNEGSHRQLFLFGYWDLSLLIYHQIKIITNDQITITKQKKANHMFMPVLLFGYCNLVIGICLY